MGVVYCVIQQIFMRRYTLLFIAAITASLAMFACRATPGLSTTGIGEPYEVFVICDEPAWQGGLEASVRNCLEQQVEGLPRPENYFSVVDHSDIDNISQLELKHSKLLNINISTTNTSTYLSSEENAYATPQIIVTLYAPDAESAKQYIDNNGHELRELFEASARSISLSNSIRSKNDAMTSLFAQKVGYNMHIPGGFVAARAEEDESLLWLVRNYNKMRHYIFAFTSPVDNPYMLTIPQLIDNINDRLKVIHAENKPQSYMALSDDFSKFPSARDIDGRIWYELRACWMTHNDFMGGPIVAYTTINDDMQSMTTIAFALYAPGVKQRQIMADLEYLIHTVSEQ